MHVVSVFNYHDLHQAGFISPGVHSLVSLFVTSMTLKLLTGFLQNLLAGCGVGQGEGLFNTAPH